MSDIRGDSAAGASGPGPADARQIAGGLVHTRSVMRGVPGSVNGGCVAEMTQCPYDACEDRIFCQTNATPAV